MDNINLGINGEDWRERCTQIKLHFLKSTLTEKECSFISELLGDKEELYFGMDCSDEPNDDIHKMSMDELESHVLKLIEEEGREYVFDTYVEARKEAYFNTDDDEGIEYTDEEILEEEESLNDYFKSGIVAKITKDNIKIIDRLHRNWKFNVEKMLTIQKGTTGDLGRYISNHGERYRELELILALYKNNPPKTYRGLLLENDEEIEEDTGFFASSLNEKRAEWFSKNMSENSTIEYNKDEYTGHIYEPSCSRYFVYSNDFEEEVLLWNEKNSSDYLNNLLFVTLHL